MPPRRHSRARAMYPPQERIDARREAVQPAGPASGDVESGGVFFARVVAQRAQERLLLAGRHNVNSVPSANLFAEQAPDAGLFVDLHFAEIDRRVLRRRRDAIERANVHAYAASVAIVRMDDGDRALGALEHVRHLAVIVHDRVVGADDAARAAIDAHRGFDVIDLFRQARDGAGGAALFTRTAAGAILGNDLKWHAASLFSHFVDDAFAMAVLDQLIVA